MDNLIITLFVVGALFILWGLRGLFFDLSSNQIGIDGKLIWVDRGKHTKPFFNQDFRVLGKPDLMYKKRSGVMAVEYKSRNAMIYDSDIVQGLTASLAARGNGYKVSSLLVKTDKAEEFIRLPKRDPELYRMIQKYVAIVRKAKAGDSLPSIPSYYKCLNCAYTEACLKK